MLELRKLKVEVKVKNLKLNNHLRCIIIVVILLLLLLLLLLLHLEYRCKCFLFNKTSPQVRSSHTWLAKTSGNIVCNTQEETMQTTLQVIALSLSIDYICL